MSIIFLLKPTSARPLPEDCLCVSFCQELVDKRFGFFIGSLPDMPVANDTFFVDQNRRWPGPDPVTLPNLKAVVLYDWIADPQLLCRRFHFVQGSFPETLQCVHSDNSKTLLFVFVVPAPQLRDNVLTVDSAVGPKFNHDNPALQVADRERFSIKQRPTGNIRSRFPGSKGLAEGGPKAPSRQCNREKKPIDKAIAQNVSGFSYQ